MFCLIKKKSSLTKMSTNGLYFFFHFQICKISKNTYICSSEHITVH